MDLFRPLHPFIGRYCRYCCWCRDHQQQQELAVPSPRQTHFPYTVHTRNLLLRQFMFLAFLFALNYLLAYARFKGQLEAYTSTLFSSLVFNVNFTVDYGTMSANFSRAFLPHLHHVRHHCSPLVDFTTRSTSWYRYRSMNCVPPSVGSTFWSGDDRIFNTDS